MTVLWSEGFDNQNAAADILQGVLSSITGSFALAPGYQFSGKAVALTSTTIGTAAVAAKNVPNTVQGFTHNNIDLAISGSSTDYYATITFYDATAGAPQVTVQIEAHTGSISVYRGWGPYSGTGGSTGTLLGSSASGAFPTNIWATIEIGVGINSTTGSVSIRVNNTAVAGCSVTGVNTQNTGNAFFSQVQYGCNLTLGSGPVTALFDDFYIGDNSGSTFNSFIGPGAILTRFASANEAVSFTPLSGTNFEMINEQAMDGDTSYNFSPTVGQSDLFSSAGTLSIGWNPLFVKLQQASRADNTTGRSAANLLVSGASTFTGASISKGTLYGYQEDYLLTDPATTGTWTAQSIEASQFGYVVAG